jgi:hypothetical protein
MCGGVYTRWLNWCTVFFFTLALLGLSCILLRAGIISLILLDVGIVSLILLHVLFDVEQLWGSKY